MQPTLLHFQTAASITIAAEAYGSPSQPPVILLHGGGQTRHSWGESARRISETGYYVIAPDARGHGDSSWSESGSYGFEYLIDDLKEIIRQLGKKPALVGASMGGLTALLAQGESAEPIAAAIVLVDIAPRTEQKGIERIFAFMSANAQDGFHSLDEAADAVAAYLPNREKPQDLDRLQKNLRQRTDERWYWHWDPVMLKVWREYSQAAPDQLMRNEERLYTAARHLAIPTLIVRGGMSDVVSEHVMAEFMDAVPYARSVSVSNAGHLVAGDNNHTFTGSVIEFLQEVYPVKGLTF